MCDRSQQKIIEMRLFKELLDATNEAIELLDKSIRQMKEAQEDEE